MNICEAMGMSISHFESILKMTQRELKEHLVQQLRAHDYEPVCKSGFLYAEGTVPVLLVAHLDTVHTHRPDIICCSEDGRYLMSPYGIGGDDRAGVYMILMLMRECHCHIRTHNTDLKKRLAAYAGQHPDQCRQTDADPETGCMEFEIRKGRFSFRLTAPYNEERRRAASEAAKKCGVHRKITHLYGDSN